jgi:hypothetical protein
VNPLDILEAVIDRAEQEANVKLIEEMGFTDPFKHYQQEDLGRHRLFTANN